MDAAGDVCGIQCSPGPGQAACIIMIIVTGGDCQPDTRGLSSVFISGGGEGGRHLYLDVY